MMNLSTEYAGLTLTNPIIAASSGLTESLANVKEIAEAGAGAVVLKSIFEEEILMEMEQTNQSMTNRPYIFPETMDYMEEDSKEDLIRSYLTLISDCKKAVDIPVIASINAVSNQKWTYLAGEIEKAGADALELNLFALPSEVNMPSEELEEMYLSIVEKVTSEVSIPVTLKISHYFTAMGQMISKLAATKIKGLVLFNRYYSADIDIDQEELTSSFVLSNPAEIALPLRWIGLMSSKTKIDFAGSTGVQDGAALVKMLLAGASTVQVATVLYKNGLSVIEQMKSFLSDWMKDKGYKSVNDFKGKLSYKEQGNPASWERVQFMKEFRHFVN